MKALFLPFTPSLGHVSRCLAVAEAWQTAGHSAVFGIGPERRKLVQKAGFETHLLPEVSVESFRTDRGMRWLDTAYFTENLSTDQMLIQHTAPDVVVGDFRFTASTAAILEELPCACILHGNTLRMAYELKETALILLGEETIGTREERNEEDGEEGGKAQKVNSMTMRKRWIRWMFPRVFKNRIHGLAKRLDPALKAQKLPTVESAYELLLGDLNLLADLPEFLPTELPEGCQVVGPLAWSGWSAPAPWLDELTDKPLIAVMLGSTAEIPGLLETILQAFTDAPYNAVIATAWMAEPEEGSLPPNVRLFSTFPGGKVMRRSAAAIHLGGHVTLMQALVAGIPSLVIPANPDQLLTSRLSERLGVAHLLWTGGDLPIPPDPRKPSNLKPEQIRQALDDLLSDTRYSTRCQPFPDKIGSLPGAKGAVKLLERLVINSQVTEEDQAE